LFRVSNFEFRIYDHLRLAAYLFPPLGLWLLWRSPRRLRSKLLGTAGLLLYSLLYIGFIIFLLIRFTGLQVEWRGGYLPRLTWRKTRPDFDALERSRQSHHAATLAPSSAHSSYWTGFRGPHRDGIYDEEPIATNWPPEGLKLLWKQPIGGGDGSFAIAAGIAFTIEQRRDKEALVAYDLQTGNEIWVHAWPADFHDFYSEGGPRSTPTYSEGKVYALGALGTLTCVEAATGKPLWSHEIVAENHGDVPTYGLAPSPLVIDRKLIVLTSAGQGHSVLCLDKETGKTLWSALDDTTGYASPMLVQLAGEAQVIVCCEQRTVGLDPNNGKLLWECPWRVKNNQLPIAQPVVLGTNRFMLSAGYFTGCAAFEVIRIARPEMAGVHPSSGAASNPAPARLQTSSAPGDANPAAGEDGRTPGADFSARVLWQNSNLKNKFTSSVLWQGYIYGLDEDILTCLDANTGERKWKDGRYGYGQLVLASGYLVILSGDGELALVRATPDRHDEVARFQAIHGKTWNHPAIAAGKLLIRNSAEMGCFDLR
jgi:outer membrane protein assembly factor BamB